MFIRFIITGLLILAFSAPLAAQPAPPKILKIIIQGNEALSENQIREVMETRSKKWKFWQKSPRLDPTSLLRDEDTLLQLYRNEGYYQAKINLESEEKEPGVVVNVLIREGLPVKIRRIVLDLENFDKREREDLEKFMKEAGLDQGLVFRLKAFRRVKQGFIDYLADQSRPKPVLFARAKVSAGQGWADLEFRLAKGPAMVMGPVVFEGLTRTKKRVLKKEIPWQGGEPYGLEFLQEFKRRLMDLGVFLSVRIEPVLDEVDDSREGQPVLVKVTVAERKPRSVEFGIGYGSEDSLRLKGSYTTRSIFGLADHHTLEARYSSREYGGQAIYLQPHFLFDHQTMKLQLAHLETEEVSFSNRRSFGLFQLERPLIAGLKIKLGYLAEYNRPFSIKVPHSVEEVESVFVSALRFGAVHDTRDDRLDPSRGSLFQVWSEAAPRFLGSEVSYLRLDVGISRYYQATPWLTFGGRLRAANITALDPTGSIPIYKRLFAGGSNSIRGYPFQKLGPLDDNSRPLGGLSLIEASLEARFSIWGPLGGVVFAEAGNLSAETWSMDFSKTKYTAGVGIRIKTLVGPLRFDMGYQLNPPEGADFSRFHFYFNIGQAF